jgi:hypothetical protein
MLTKSSVFFNLQLVVANRNCRFGFFSSRLCECFDVMKKILLLAFLIGTQSFVSLRAAEPTGRWNVAEAQKWEQQSGWLVGCNFIPSTAINQLEMWQDKTFDAQTIDRELGWAQQLGFNGVRVYLHDLLWQKEANSLLRRMDEFLNLAAKHHIKVGFVIFDSCWDPNPHLGEQPAPKPHVHNSGWVQSPGRVYMENPDRLDELKPYVVGVIGHFRKDKRIAFWDLFNEPDNLNIAKESDAKKTTALLLLKKVYAWAREVNPSQPLTSAVWHGNWSKPGDLSPFEKIQLQDSDIITFHNYGSKSEIEKCVQVLSQYGRPLVCSEYMARPRESTFDPVLGYLKEKHVGAFNWGFVSGKTQTIYSWDSWTKSYTNEPPLWFHDILRADGTPYRAQEVEYIRSLTLKSPRQ